MSLAFTVAWRGSASHLPGIWWNPQPYRIPQAALYDLYSNPSLGTRHQPRVVGSNGLDVLTVSDDLLFRCPGVIIVGRIAEYGFSRTRVRSPASCERPSALVLPPSRREGVLSRLRLHTLRTFLREMSIYLRMLRGSPGGQSCQWSSLRAGPGVHFLDLPPVTQSYEAKDSDKTSVWSLAFMLPFLSIYNIRPGMPPLDVIGHAVTGIFSPPHSDLTT